MNPWHFDGFGVPKFGDKIDTNHTNQRSRKDTQGGLWLAIHGLQMAREGRGADPQKDASKILQFVYVYVLHVETIASRLDIAYLLVHLIFVGEPHSQQVGRAFAVIKQLSIWLAESCPKGSQGEGEQQMQQSKVGTAAHNQTSLAMGDRHAKARSRAPRKRQVAIANIQTRCAAAMGWAEMAWVVGSLFGCLCHCPCCFTPKPSNAFISSRHFWDIGRSAWSE